MIYPKCLLTSSSTCADNASHVSFHAASHLPRRPERPEVGKQSYPKMNAFVTIEFLPLLIEKRLWQVNVCVSDLPFDRKLSTGAQHKRRIHVVSLKKSNENQHQWFREKLRADNSSSFIDNNFLSSSSPSETAGANVGIFAVDPSTRAEDAMTRIHSSNPIAPCVFLLCDTLQ